MKLFEAGSLWSYKGYRLFWFSTTIFVLGASAFPVALAVTVLDAGGSATTLGLILGARILSSVLFAPFAGVWVDRLPRKLVMITADLFRATIVFSMVFMSAPSMPHYALGIAVFVMGIGDALGASSASAFVPLLLPEEKRPAGNVARGVVVRMASIVGPGIGGASVLLIGGRMTFIFTSVAFVFGTYFLVKIKEDVNTPRKPHEPFVSELREGLRTVWQIKWVGAMIAMASVQLMVVLAAEAVLLPIITRREFHTNSVFAASAAAFSVGGVISAIIFAKIKVRHEGRTSVLIWMLLILAPLVLAFPVNETVVIGAYLLAGLSVGPWEAYWNSAIQREIPAELQGRVFSIDHMGSSGLMPLGMALVGPAVTLFGEKDLLIGASIFHIFICLLVLMVPGVKDMKAPANYSQGEQG